MAETTSKTELSIVRDAHDDGTLFTISCQLDATTCLAGARTEATMETRGEDPSAEKWRLKLVTDPIIGIQIIVDSSGKCLASAGPGLPVTMQDSGSVTRQNVWAVIPATGKRGWYSVQPYDDKESQRLDVQNDDRSTVTLHKANGSANQLWQFAQATRDES